MRARVENLQQMKQEFMEFIEYRDLERHNLETFQMKEEEQKAAALEVLDLLKKKVESEDGDEVGRLLVCVVAPRCYIKLEPCS